MDEVIVFGHEHINNCKTWHVNLKLEITDDSFCKLTLSNVGRGGYQTLIMFMVVNSIGMKIMGWKDSVLNCKWLNYTQHSF